jgi:hypothetical protein
MSSEVNMGSVLAKLRLLSPFEGNAVEWILTFVQPSGEQEQGGESPLVLLDDERMIVLARPTVPNDPTPPGWVDGVSLEGMWRHEKNELIASRIAFGDLYRRFTETMPFENLKLLIEHNFPPGARLTRTEIYYRTMFMKATSHCRFQCPAYKNGNWTFEQHFLHEMLSVTGAIKWDNIVAPTVSRDLPKLLRNIGLRICQSWMHRNRERPPAAVPMTSLERLFKEGFCYSNNPQDVYDSDGVYFCIDPTLARIDVNDPAFDHIDEFPLALLTKRLRDTILNREYTLRSGRYVGFTVNQPFGSPLPSEPSPLANHVNGLLLLADSGTADDSVQPLAQKGVHDQEDDAESTHSSFVVNGADDTEEMEIEVPDDDMTVEVVAGRPNVDHISHTTPDDDSDASMVGYFELPRNFLYWFGRGVCPVTGRYFSWRIRYLHESAMVSHDEDEVE